MPPYTTRIIVPPRIRRSGAPGTPGGMYSPQVLGVRRAFGFGDRLGAAAAGCVAVAGAHPEFAPVFAQTSGGEAEPPDRTFKEALASATGAVGAARFRAPWGADADRLRTPQAVEAAAAAGYTYFTFDAGEFVRGEADEMKGGELAAALAAMLAAGEFPEDWGGPYLGRTIDLPGGQVLRLTDEPMQQAVVKFGRAINHCARLSETLARASQGRPFEVEAAFDGTDVPATTLEHLFIGLELEARGLRLTSLALRLPDDPAEAEAILREHAAVAQFCGPYKLAVHRGEEKLALYPALGRVCGDALHVKTSGASYLEALRVVRRVDPALFTEIVEFCTGQSANGGAVPGGLATSAADGDEAVWFDDPAIYRLLLATDGPVLAAGQTARGQPFKEAILERLEGYADVYHAALSECYEKHFALLQAG